MTIADKQQALDALAEAHAKTLDALIEAGIVESDKAYQQAGLTAKDKEKRESAIAALGVALGLLLQRNRTAANELATMHSQAELRTIIGQKAERLSLPFGPSPKPTDMAKYIANAQDLARKAESIESTSHRGRLIVASETEAQYSKGKGAVNDHLIRLPESEAEKAGVKVAKTQDEIDGADKTPSEGAVAIITKRWYHLNRNEPACCPYCKGMHGIELPLDVPFPYGDPPIHPHCHCNLYLSTAGYAPAKRAMDPKALPQINRTPLQTRFDCSIDERASFDVENRTIKGAIASDESVDAHDSVIRASGWRLERYNKNPVLIWAHKASGWRDPQPEDVLGTATVRVDGSALVADLHFAPKGLNTKADMVFDQMQAKIIRGLSVGFSPISYHFEKRNGGEILVVDEQELVELSIVPVPSNENTLAKQIRGYLQECESATDRAPEAPQTENNMSGTNASVVLLPAVLAALLHVDSVDDAVREISKKDLELDAMQKKLEKAEVRATTAEKALEERAEAESVSMVESLISAERISPDKKESALALARTSPKAFRDLYPPLPEAPKANLLKRIVTVEDKTASEPKTDIDPIMPRVRELQSQGVQYMQAYSQALREYEAKKSA